MNKEIYWEKALSQTEISFKNKSLFPLRTVDITKNISDSSEFIIRELDISLFKNKRLFGPQPNPFNPWEKNLEVHQIGNNHQLILNKYPVQKGHLLLITNRWKPQSGWLEKEDWNALKEVNMDTSGLWFFNSCKSAGASQPHRHIQLLRRGQNEKSCPREDWFLRLLKSKNNENKLSKNIIVHKLDLNNNSEYLYNLYLNLSKKVGLGSPKTDESPKKAHNILLTNKWIAIIKRSKDNVHGISVNSLGFAGYLLVTEYSDLTYLAKYGPEKLLEDFV